jgi:2-oxoglutarate ferredoxin oxidoreductase subunit delta
MKLWRKPFDYIEKATAPGRVYIDKERCKGCGYCVEFCPREVLRVSSELSPKGYYLAAVDDESKCLACE